MNIVITANGEGARMKGLSPNYKALLWYKGRRIIQALSDTLQGQFQVEPVVLSCYDLPYLNVRKIAPTTTRLETLQHLAGMKDVLIVDCDIAFDRLPNFFGLPYDFLYYFNSTCEKYASLFPYKDGECLRLGSAYENGTVSNFRASGVYFVKEIDTLLKRMTEHPNSIAAAMTGALMIREDNFVRLGDIEDYKTALGL